MSSTVFLSTVTGEFGPFRKRFAAFLQRTNKIHVQHQDGFFNRGVRTLHLLEEEVAESQVVLHVIGARPGWCVPGEQVEELLQRHPDFEARFPQIAAEGRRGEVPATQWEAWLALLLDRRLCCYAVDGPSITDPSQQQHLRRLQAARVHPTAVADEESLLTEIIGSLTTLGLLTAEQARRPISLPYRSLDTLFKGRQDSLEDLRRSLRAAKGIGRATAITGKAVHGLGGVGKTRLAVEYAWQYADDCSAVLFITADSPEALWRNLAELTGPLVLDLPEHQATEEEVRVAAALYWLAEHPGWFLILDNVDTDAAVDCVTALLPKLHGGSVLITSRSARWGGDVEPLALDVLQPDDAAGFLIERTQPRSGGRGRKPQSSDQQDAATLAGDLDGLALALEQAGAYIVARRITLADYRKRWQEHDAAVQTWHNERDMQYPRSMAATWETTLEQLGPEAIDLLNTLAWFAPESLPLSVLGRFSGFLQVEEEDGNTEGAEGTEEEQRQAWSEDSIREVLAALADFSMIRWDAEAETVSVHRVVQEILRTRQNQPQAYLTAALKLLDAALPEGDADDVRTWPAWELLRPHVAFAVLEGKRLDIAVPTSRLMGELGGLLWSKALHNEAASLERDALALDAKQFGSDSTEVAVRLNNLAQTLKATNRLAEAEPLMRRGLAIEEQSKGANHPHVAIQLNNLALLFRETNRLAEAEPLMRRALAIDEASYGAEHPDVAIDLNNLALLLQDTNRLAEAELLMRRALAIFEQTYGAEHPNVATNLNNLASLLQDTNRLAEAEPLMQRAVEIFHTSLGPDHPSTKTVAANLQRLLKEKRQEE